MDDGSWHEGSLFPGVKRLVAAYQDAVQEHGANSVYSREVKRRLLESLDAEARGDEVLPDDPPGSYDSN